MVGVSKEIMQNNRIVYLDILKLIATFGVVVLHVYCVGHNSLLLSQNWYISVIGNALVRWTVPLFVMISGTLFLDPRKEISYSNLIKKYEKRLIVSFLFWSCLYSIIFVAYKLFQREAVDVSQIHLHFHLWFLPMLMGVYLLIPILKSIFTNQSTCKWVLLVWGGYLLGLRFQDLMIPQIASLFGRNCWFCWVFRTWLLLVYYRL